MEVEIIIPKNKCDVTFCSRGDDHYIPESIFWWLEDNDISYSVSPHDWCGDDFGAYFSFDSEEDAVAFKLTFG